MWKMSSSRNCSSENTIFICESWWAKGLSALKEHARMFAIIRIFWWSWYFLFLLFMSLVILSQFLKMSVIFDWSMLTSFSLRVIPLKECTCRQWCCWKFGRKLILVSVTILGKILFFADDVLDFMWYC